MRQPLQFLLLIPATVAALATAVGAQAQTRGLTAAPDALGGPVWQARFERDTHALPLAGLSSWLMPATTPQRATPAAAAPSPTASTATSSPASRAGSAGRRRSSPARG